MVIQFLLLITFVFQILIFAPDYAVPDPFRFMVRRPPY